MSEVADLVSHDVWTAGKKSPQGDLPLVAVSALPKSAKSRKDRQLAEGSTRGSRHMVEGGEVYDADAGELSKMLKKDAGIEVDPKYIGPIFSGECTITHPQHAHQKFPAHECTVVVFQRNLDM